MAGNSKMTVFIGADNSEFLKKMSQTQRALKRGFGSDALEMSSGAAGVLLGIAAAAGIAGAAAIKMSADYTASKTAFTTLLGDAQKAENMLADLATFAADTPFELPGLIKASQKLMAFGFASEDIIPIMSAVGDAISLVGGGQEAIDGVVRALGQIQAKGKLSAEEMNQLAERGINGWKYLADQMGISVAEVMDLCKDGAIDSTTAINAVVMGMQHNFKGGMEALSQEIPGLLSTIKDNAGMVLKGIGDSLTESLGLKQMLSELATWLTEFATVAKAAGIKEAIQGMFPPEALAAAAALAGVLVAAAIPAMVAFAASVWAAIVPLAPFIAAGAAIGAVAYEIWNNWEPLTELFGAMWETITQLFADACDFISELLGDSTAEATGIVDDGWEAAAQTTDTIWSGICEFINSAWEAIKQVVADGVNWILEAMQPLLDLIGSSIPDGIKNMFSNLSNGISKVAAAASKLHLGGKDVSGILSGGVNKPNTNFTGLHNQSAGGGADKGSGKGSNKEAKEWEKLEKKAHETSKRIQKEWIELTGTKIDALNDWYADELEKLDESAAANENYNRDLQRLNEIYAEKKRKIANQEAQDRLNSFRTIADGWLAMNKELTLGGMSGSKKELTSKAFGFAEKIKSAGDYYDKISTDYANATDQQKQNILDALNQVGIAYQKTTQDTLDFSIAKTQAAEAYKRQFYKETADYYAQCKDIQADVDAAYNSMSLSQLQAALTAENAERLNNYEAQKTMMDTYKEAFLAAHSTTAQLMADMYSSGFGALKSNIADVLTGTKSISEAWSALGQTILQVIANWIAQWIAGQLMMAIFGQSSMDSITGANTAAGAATAAAWAPAAAMVSLATFGANSGPAMAGIAATNGVAMGFAIPGLASGGITTGPAFAQIGEGHRQEAVLPLDRKVFDRMGLTSNGEGGSTTNNFTFAAWDAKSVKNWLENGGGDMIMSYANKKNKMNPYGKR